MTSVGFERERKIIEDYRELNQVEGAFTIAKRIYQQNLVGGRSFYSIYSVVRRYDTRAKNAAKQATAV